MEGLGAGGKAGSNTSLSEELSFEILLRYVDARIERDSERLLHYRAVADEKDFVRAGNGEWAESLFARRIGRERVVGDGVLDVIKQAAVVAEIQSLRRIVAQIPNETIQSGIFREMRGRTEPIIRNVFGRGIHRRDKAGETADYFSLRVVDFERERVAGNGFQVVVNDCAVGRIFRRGFFGRQRSFLVVVITSADYGCGLEQIRVGGGDFRAGLTARREGVEDQEGAAVGGGDEIVAMHCEVANVRGREIQLQGLPVVAIVE